MHKNSYLELHIIQTVPPSCVNRDDTGSPKTAVYGGTLRARVSSQAWKRAMRMMFRDLFTEEYTGYRTRNTVQLTAEALCRMEPQIDAEEALQMAGDILALAKVKPESGKKDVLFFVSHRQIEETAKLAAEYGRLSKTEKKKQAKEYTAKVNAALCEHPSVDILLFGRMAANNPSLNFDAASQVAHSISTHTISNEYDYFTAVDDFDTTDSTGAGHIGTVEFNSSTLYRYAVVNVRELAEFLSTEELGQALRGFAEAFIRSMPTGKQNTFANRTLPDLVYVTLRDDQSVNLAGAFERPVQAGDGGYVKRSEEALFRYASEVYANYVPEPAASWTIGTDAGAPGEKVNLPQLLDAIEAIAQEF